MLVWIRQGLIQSTVLETWHWSSQISKPAKVLDIINVYNINKNNHWIFSIKTYKYVDNNSDANGICFIACVDIFR